MKKSQWTIDTLKQIMDERFSSREKLMDERFNSQDKAITKAETANEKRFDGVNEFRLQLKDQASTFITRTEHDALLDNVKKLEAFQATMQGSATQGNTGRLQNNWMVGIAVSIAVMFISIVGIIITLIKH